MDLILYAHRNGVALSAPTAGVDYVVKFAEVIKNVGNCYNPTTGEIVLAAGEYFAQVNLSVVNPSDGGKYYGFFTKNGIQQIGIMPARMSGGNDTCRAGTLVPLWGDGVSKFVPTFQHSNDSGSKIIDGQEEGGWLAVWKVSDTVLARPTKIGTMGPLSGPAMSGTHCVIDRGRPLIPGTTLIALGNYSEVAATFHNKIVKRVSAGVVDVIVSVAISHDGGGNRHSSITPWTVPNDGYEYFLGCYTDNHSMMFVDGWPRSYAASNISGTGVTVIEESPLPGRYVLGVYALLDP